MSDGAPPAAGGSRAGVNTGESQNFSGGMTLVALALIALGISFYHPGPAGFFGPVMWPRVFSLLILMAGLGMASGQMPVRNKQDFFGGLAVIGLAIVGMLASIDLPGMRGFAFGPGTAPRLFANMLASLGLIVALIGVFTNGPEGQRYSLQGVVIVAGTLAVWLLLAWVFGQFTTRYAHPLATALLIVAAFAGINVLDRVGLRGPFMITLSIFSFGIFIRPIGLVIASFLTIMMCAGASPDVRWRETFIWAVILTTFCSFLFPYGLNLPFQLWPRF